MPTRVACPSDEVLSQFLTGQLREPGSEGVEVHLLACLSCQLRLEEVQTTDSVLNALQAETPPESLIDPRTIDSFIRRIGSEPPPNPGPITEGRATASFPLENNGTTAESAPPLPDAASLHLEAYEVKRLLGRGGMGAVYEGFDPQLQRRVAIKVMKPALARSEVARERFLREARAVAAIQDDHIVAIHQVGELTAPDGTRQPYLVLPLLDGMTLEAFLQGRPPLPTSVACNIGEQIALGLRAAHERGLVHRDIKPSNIWLQGFGIRDQESGIGDQWSSDPQRPPTAVGGRVKIFDFGLVRNVGAEDGNTSEGVILGTPAYMAPEQAARQPIDARTDLFSLGCVLYRMAAGKQAFKGDDLLATLRSVAVEEPPPVREANPELAPKLAELIHQLLAKDRDQRPVSAAEVVHRLRVIQLPAARPPTRRWRVATLVAGAAALLILAMGVFTFKNSKGDEFTITTDDPTVEVLVRNGGKEVVIVDPTTKQRWQLDTEKYQLRDADRPDGLTIELPGKEPFILRRKGERIASIERTVRGKPVADRDRLPADAIDITQQSPELKLVRKHPWLERHAFRTRFSSNGQHYAAGGGAGKRPDEGIRVWESASGKEVITVPGTVAFAFSPDGKHLYAATEGDFVIRCWDLSTKQQLHQFKGHRTSVADLAVTKDGKILISSSIDRTVRFWNTENQEQSTLLSLALPVYPLLSLSQDGKSVLVGDLFGNDRTFRLADAGSGEVKRRWTIPGNTYIEPLQLSADGREFVVVDPKRFRFWKTDQDDAVRTLRLPYGAVGGVAFSPDLNWSLFSVATEPFVYLLNLSTGNIHGQYELSHNSISMHGFSPDGRYAVFCTIRPSTVYVFEMPKEVWIKKGP